MNAWRSRVDPAIERIVAARALVPCIDDDTWDALCAAIDGLPFPPAYQVKTLQAHTAYPLELAAAPDYHGDWGQTPEAELGTHVEWIRIAPRYRRLAGRLLPPVIDDCSDDLRRVLQALAIEFEEDAGFFVVRGYVHGAAG